jgi:hypothetical protein
MILGRTVLSIRMKRMGRMAIPHRPRKQRIKKLTWSANVAGETDVLLPHISQ